MLVHNDNANNFPAHNYRIQEFYHDYRQPKMACSYLQAIFHWQHPLKNFVLLLFHRPLDEDHQQRKECCLYQLGSHLKSL